VSALIGCEYELTTSDVNCPLDLSVFSLEYGIHGSEVILVALDIVEGSMLYIQSLWVSRESSKLRLLGLTSTSASSVSSAHVGKRYITTDRLGAIITPRQSPFSIEPRGSYRILVCSISFLAQLNPGLTIRSLIHPPTLISKLSAFH
jgi:hypothetical protein